MKVSIITINYNNRAGLELTIKSVLSQSYFDYEWIVIDGGSTDGSEAIIEENKLRFAYYCIEPDDGVWDAMNKGVSHAVGEYVVFMNSGDLFADENTLEDVFTSGLSGDIIYGNTINCVDNNRKKLITHPSCITLSYLVTNTINHQSTFIRRSLQQKYLYDKKYKFSADRKFWIQALMYGASFQFIDRPIARYDCCGISSNNLECVFSEQSMIAEECIPWGVLEDIKLFIKYKRIKEDYPILSALYQNLHKKGINPILRFLIKIFEKC